MKEIKEIKEIEINYDLKDEELYNCQVIDGVEYRSIKASIIKYIKKSDTLAEYLSHVFELKNSEIESIKRSKVKSTKEFFYAFIHPHYETFKRKLFIR